MPAVRIPEEGLQARFTWLRRVEEGEYLVTTLEGRDAVQVRAIDESSEGSSLPPLGKWRTSIDVRGEGLSTVAEQQRGRECDHIRRHESPDCAERLGCLHPAGGSGVEREIADSSSSRPVRLLCQRPRRRLRRCGFDRCLRRTFPQGRPCNGGEDGFCSGDGAARVYRHSNVGKTEEYIDGFEDESKDGDFLDTMG